MWRRMTAWVGGRWIERARWAVMSMGRSCRPRCASSSALALRCSRAGAKLFAAPAPASPRARACRPLFTDVTITASR